MRRSIVLFAILATVYTQTTPVQQCIHDGGSLPVHVYIEGCSTLPCALPQLQDAVLNIVLKAPYKLESMRTLATAFLNIGIITIPLPYDLGESTYTCNFLQNASCPVNKDEVLTYKLKMFIEPFFPQGTTVTIEFRVVDPDNESIMCISVPIRIVAPLDSTRANFSIAAIEN